MTAEEWMLRVRGINADITALNELYYSALGRATDTTSTLMSDRVIRTRENSSEAKMIKASDYALRIKAAIESKEKLVIEVFETIEKVGNPQERALLRYYYINGLTWEEVAEKMNMSVRYVSGELKRRALFKIEKIRKHVSSLI